MIFKIFVVVVVVAVVVFRGRGGWGYMAFGGNRRRVLRGGVKEMWESVFDSWKLSTLINHQSGEIVTVDKNLWHYCVQKVRKEHVFKTKKLLHKNNFAITGHGPASLCEKKYITTTCMRPNSFYFTNNDHNDSQTRIYRAICSYCFLQDTLKKILYSKLKSEKKLCPRYNRAISS